MRALICGGRNSTAERFIYGILDILHKTLLFDVIIEGDARGVDRIAGYWARKNKIENLKFPAKWKEHGKSAGPLRNAQMLAEGRPDIVIAFPGGAGTEDMVRRARAADVGIFRVSLSGTIHILDK